MGWLDFVTRPETRWLDPGVVEQLWKDYRRVIPADRQYTKFIPPEQLTREHEALMERYFQVKPDYFKPTVQRPNWAIALVIGGGVVFLLDLLFGHSNFFVFVFFFLLSVAGGAIGSVWYYRRYEPLRRYLYPMENYLVRETITYEAYQAWMDASIEEMRRLAATRLNIDLDAIKRAEMEDGVTVGDTLISKPRYIMGFWVRDDKLSRWTGYIPIYVETRPRSQLAKFASQLTGNRTPSSTLAHVANVELKFKVADHVEYGNGFEHWREIHYLMVIPLSQALGVYDTTVDALDLESVDNVTSEYFYQSVQGLQTRVEGGVKSQRRPRTTFSLLIGNGIESPSISTINDLRETIIALRAAISDMKARALRKEMAEGGSTTVPTDDEMRARSGSVPPPTDDEMGEGAANGASDRSGTRPADVGNDDVTAPQSVPIGATPFTNM